MLRLPYQESFHIHLASDVCWLWISIFSTMILNTIKEGKIVPSELTIRLIQKEMESSDNYKFLIDGFPRSEENRIAFEQIVSFFYTLSI